MKKAIAITLAALLALALTACRPRIDPSKGQTLPGGAAASSATAPAA